MGLGIRNYLALGGAILLAVLAVAVKLHLAGDERTRGKLDAMTQQSAGVLSALRIASDNPKLKWKDAAGQAVALGEDRRQLRISIDETNRRIDDMAREAVRLRARADELRRIADKAEAQRAGALAKLNDLSITPGTRSDCMTLLREAEEALDTVYQAGL